MAARRSKPGLWVMEGRWSASVKDVRSVSPILSALQDAGQASHAMHHINDPEDLLLQLKKWGQKQHVRYNLGYVALHGAPGTLYIGRKSVDLFSLEDELHDSNLKQKILHFGSCSVLELKPKERQSLRMTLGVKAMTGFTEDVDWFESLAFELMLFEILTYYKRLDAADAYIKKNHGPFAKRLGFVIVR